MTSFRNCPNVDGDIVLARQQLYLTGRFVEVRSVLLSVCFSELIAALWDASGYQGLGRRCCEGALMMLLEGAHVAYSISSSQANI